MNSKLLLCFALVLSGGLFNSISVALGQTNSNVQAEAFVPSPKEQTGHSNSTNTTVELKTPEEFQTEVQAGYAKFIPMVTNRLGTNYGPVAAKGLAEVETNVLTALTNSALPEMSAAGEFLKELKKEGRLPGVPQAGHGHMGVNAPLAAFQEATYPFTVKFDLVVEGDSLTNHYTVARPQKDAAWRLERAWRTDAEGRTIKEWPVK